MRKTIRRRLQVIITMFLIGGIILGVSGNEFNLVDDYETKYEDNVLKKRCYLDQLTRLKTNKPVFQGYCEQQFNLNKYKLTNLKRVEKKKEQAKEIIYASDKLDINKLAYAVAMAETGNCSLGYGKMYNNCFGIKSGNTAPCKAIGKNRMCIYDNPEESYEAFKKIRTTWYKTLPNIEKRSRWTGHDNRNTWMNNVLHYYNK